MEIGLAFSYVYVFLFWAHITLSFSSIVVVLKFFILVVYVNAQVLGTTFVHEFHIL